MTTLHSKSMRWAEFDEKITLEYLDHPDRDWSHGKNAFILGARWQSEQNKPLIEALASCAELLESGLRIIDHPVGIVPEDKLVKQLGDQIGYGALMDSAARCWREKLKPDGIEGGEFTVGSCRILVEQALSSLAGIVGNKE